MDMKQWRLDTLGASRKKAIPVLSFPSIQLQGITVRELISYFHEGTHLSLIHI